MRPTSENYLVHRKNKRLPPVAEAFKNFLLQDGAALIQQIIEPPKRSTAGRQ